MKATPYNQKTIAEFQAKKGRGVGMWVDHVLLMTADDFREFHAGFTGKRKPEFRGR